VLIDLQWHAARWTPGIVRIVLDGASPARVSDAVIAEIRSRERNGLVELPKPPQFKRGDAVRILKGPFVHHVGLYHGMKPRDRIEVLLSLLGGRQRVTLPRDDVEALVR
jgi:transcription antitermination factor NusG